MNDLTYDQRLENEKKKAMDAYRWTLDNPVKANIAGGASILGGLAGGVGAGYLANKYLGTGSIGTSATGLAGGLLSSIVIGSLTSYLLRKAEKESLENEARIRKFRETGKIASFKKRAATVTSEVVNPGMSLGEIVHRDRGIVNGTGTIGGGLLVGLPAAYIGEWLARRFTKDNKRDLGTSLIGLASGIAAAYFGGDAIGNWATKKYDEGLTVKERVAELAHITKGRIDDAARQAYGVVSKY